MERDPDITQVVRKRLTPRKVEPEKAGLLDAIGAGISAFRRSLGGREAAGDLIGKPELTVPGEGYGDFIYMRSHHKKEDVMLLKGADVTPELCSRYVNRRPQDSNRALYCPYEDLTAVEIVVFVLLKISPEQVKSECMAYPGVKNENDFRTTCTDPSRYEGCSLKYLDPQKLFEHIVHKYTEKKE